jgi:hypothetical protein
MRRATLFGFIPIALCVTLSGVTHAAYVVNLTESGGNVVAIGSGTINTTDLTFVQFGNAGAELDSSDSVVLVGPKVPVTTSIYSGLTNPGSFGASIGYFVADSGSGDLVGVTGNPDWIWLPETYNSGSSLNANDVFNGQTFASLGLTPGSYVWTWGSGANADSFTLNIGAQAVPEPASLLLLGMGSLAIFSYARQRRRAAA